MSEARVDVTKVYHPELSMQEHCEGTIFAVLERMRQGDGDQCGNAVALDALTRLYQVLTARARPQISPPDAGDDR